MILKVLYGAGEWLILNGNCRFIHLKMLIKSKCEAAWPSNSTTVDLCDIETGTVVGMHTLESWDMATPCFTDVDTHQKIFIPVAMHISYKDERATIKSVTPLFDKFSEQFPEANKMLKALEKTKVRVDSAKTKSLSRARTASFLTKNPQQTKSSKPKVSKPVKGKNKPVAKK